MQLADRVLPAVAEHEVVPVRDQVAQRAPVVAERHAALHAACALLLELGHALGNEELPQVLHALARGAVGDVAALDPGEPPELAHSAGTSFEEEDSAACSASTR